MAGGDPFSSSYPLVLRSFKRLLPASAASPSSMRKNFLFSPEEEVDLDFLFQRENSSPLRDGGLALFLRPATFFLPLLRRLSVSLSSRPTSSWATAFWSSLFLARTAISHNHACTSFPFLFRKGCITFLPLNVGLAIAMQSTDGIARQAFSRTSASFFSPVICLAANGFTMTTLTELLER